MRGFQDFLTQKMNRTNPNLIPIMKNRTITGQLENVLLHRLIYLRIIVICFSIGNWPPTIIFQMQRYYALLLDSDSYFTDKMSCTWYTATTLSFHTSKAKCEALKLELCKKHKKALRAAKKHFIEIQYGMHCV